MTPFQISGITNGTLFLNNGTPPVTNGSFITFAQANAGLKFTPSANFVGDGQFDVQASTSNTVGGLAGEFTTATITVNSLTPPPPPAGRDRFGAGAGLGATADSFNPLGDVLGGVFVG